MTQDENSEIMELTSKMEISILLFQAGLAPAPLATSFMVLITFVDDLCSVGRSLTSQADGRALLVSHAAVMASLSRY